MAEDARVGTVIAGYRIESLIGRGGMSVVYLAHHESLERKAALKLLAPELAENEAFRQRFIRESRIAAGIDHPNVVPVYDAGEADGLLFISMRYVRGSDLKTLLAERGPLDPPDVVRVMDQLAAALDAAHDEGLVHRDVKPANILLSPATPPTRVGHVYLADFGLTKKSLSGSGITKSGQFVGTIDYVAPEQIRSEPVDGRTDVYSLGGVLYECLTGEPPFVRDTEVAVMFSHLNDPPPRPTTVRPELPGAIDGVVATAMAKSPADRPRTPGELAVAVRDALRDAPAQERTRMAPVATARSSRRRAILLGAAVAVAAAIVLIVSLLGGNGEPSAGPTGSRGSATGSPSPPAPLSSTPALLPSGFMGVARIDPATDQLEESFQVDLHARTGPGGREVEPRPVLAAEGALWLFNASFTETKIAKVDPDTGALEEMLHLRNNGVQSMSFAGGHSSLWALTSAGIVAPENDDLYRIDPATNEVLATIDIGRTGAGVAAGDEGVWVVKAGGELLDIDTGANRIRRTIPGIPQATGIALGGGYVWVSDAILGVVYRVDPKSEAIDTITLPGGVDGIAADADGVWVIDHTSGVVLPIDPKSKEVGQQIRVGADPTSIAVGAGSVWVTDQEEGAVYRIDPGSREAIPILVGGDPGPAWISVGEDGVWTSLG